MIFHKLFILSEMQSNMNIFLQTITTVNHPVVDCHFLYESFLNIHYCLCMFPYIQ